MASPEYDLGFLQAGISELKPYLLSDQVYWPLSAKLPRGEPAYPRLTLGWMLLNRLRCYGYHLNEKQREALREVSDEMNALKSRWRVAWGKKAAQEFHARLRLWSNFINDFRREHTNHSGRYSYEVQRRVLLHLLSQETTELTAEDRALLGKLDSYLKRVLIPGEFLWNPVLSASFPRGDYWYLYGSLSQG